MRLPKLEQWASVRVEWVDSCGPSNGGWIDSDDLPTEIVGCVTVGMVQHATTDRITLVLSHDNDNGNINGAITIPAVAITSLVPLDSKRPQTRPERKSA